MQSITIISNLTENTTTKTTKKSINVFEYCGSLPPPLYRFLIYRFGNMSHRFKICVNNFSDIFKICRITVYRPMNLCTKQVLVFFCPLRVILQYLFTICSNWYKNVYFITQSL